MYEALVFGLADLSMKPLFCLLPLSSLPFVLQSIYHAFGRAPEKMRPILFHARHIGRDILQGDATTQFCLNITQNGGSEYARTQAPMKRVLQYY
jgi:hypothetical protein